MNSIEDSVFVYPAKWGGTIMNNISEEIKKAYQEWMDALDKMDDAIFIHDKNFRILRCNMAYKKYAGLPFKDIIGRLYFEIFPKLDAPLQSSIETLKKSLIEEAKEELKVGDKLFRSHAYAMTDSNGAYLYSLQTLEDITEHKKIEKALQTSESQFRRLFETAQDGILLLDAQTGLIVNANPFILNLLHYNLEEFIGKKLWELGFFRDKEESKTAFEELKEKGYIRYSDLPLQTKDGSQIDVEFISNLYDVGERKVIQCNIRDISERLHAQEVITASYDLLKSIVEHIPVRVFWKDSDLNFLGCNTLFASDAGMSAAEELIGKDDFQMAWREQAEHYRADDREVMDSGIPKIGYEELQTTPDGTQSWVSTSKVPLRAKDGSVFGILGIYDDITSDKEAEEKLKLFRTLIDHSSDSIEVLEPSTFHFLDINEAGCKALGYSKEEILSMSVFDIDPIFDANAAEVFEKQLQQEGYSHFEGTHRRKDGSTFPIEVHTALVKLDKTYYLSNVRDITQRKMDEESLRRSNRALKTLSAGNLALVRAKDEHELLKELTRVIVENSDYALAVVDYMDEQQKSIIPVAWAGLKKHSYWIKSLPKEEDLPVTRAMLTGKTQISHDIANDPSFKLWREGALARGYLSNIALPLSKGNMVFGALCIYSSETTSFDKDEVKLLEELANDLSYGIVTLRARIASEKQTVRLQESMKQSIQAIAATVEARDPYTAGHQRRVAELATAIGQEIGLSEKKIQGIHFAAIVHDLGKINIPAEILSKPGKLNEFEYKLIQMHPQAGYDILKDIQFPWPIADIILQHHERLDGSGYPHGLIRDEILLESKIITVADVVEAISSHRPYRASRGIKYALNEIIQGRGVLFDELVVDTCLKLFNEKKFKFSKEI